MRRRALAISQVSRCCCRLLLLCGVAVQEPKGGVLAALQSDLCCSLLRHIKANYIVADQVVCVSVSVRCRSQKEICHHPNGAAPTCLTAFQMDRGVSFAKAQKLLEEEVRTTTLCYVMLCYVMLP